MILNIADRIRYLREKAGSKWSLKIEQQEISTKHCKVRNTRSRQRELYILNKVKEPKKLGIRF